MNFKRKLDQEKAIILSILWGASMSQPAVHAAALYDSTSRTQSCNAMPSDMPGNGISPIHGRTELQATSNGAIRSQNSMCTAVRKSLVDRKSSFVYEARKAIKDCCERTTVFAYLADKSNDESRKNAWKYMLRHRCLIDYSNAVSADLNWITNHQIKAIELIASSYGFPLR